MLVKIRKGGKLGQTWSKLTIKTSEQRRSGVFIVKFEHILHFALVFHC